MSIITTVKDKILKNSILARILASGKDSRTKVVLARKIEKQGLGSTPDLYCIKHVHNKESSKYNWFQFT